MGLLNENLLDTSDISTLKYLIIEKFRKTHAGFESYAGLEIEFVNCKWEQIIKSPENFQFFYCVGREKIFIWIDKKTRAWHKGFVRWWSDDVDVEYKNGDLVNNGTEEATATVVTVKDLYKL